MNENSKNLRSTAIKIAAIAATAIAIAAAAAVIAGKLSEAKEPKATEITIMDEEPASASASAQEETIPEERTEDPIEVTTTENEETLQDAEASLRGEIAEIKSNTAAIYETVAAFIDDLTYAPSGGQYGQAPFVCRHLTDGGIISFLQASGRRDTNEGTAAEVRRAAAVSEKQLIHIVSKDIYIEPKAMGAEEQTSKCICLLECCPADNIYGTPTYSIFMQLTAVKEDGRWLIGEVRDYRQL